MALTTSLPPGILFLLSNLPQVVLPPLAASLLLYALRVLYGLAPPAWLAALAYLLSWPLAWTFDVQYRDWRIQREARARGAECPPRIPSKAIGGVDLIKQFGKDMEKRIIAYRHWDFIKEFGPTYNLRVLFENRIFTAEPEYIKRILATEFPNYEKGPDFTFQMRTLLGTGVFNSDGDMWKFHRGMTRPFFSRDRISHFDIFDRHADAALGLMRARMAEGCAIDWQDLVSRFTLDSASEFLFGQDVRSLSAPLPYPPFPSASALSPLPFSSQEAYDAYTAQASTHPANRFAQSFLDAQITSARRSRFTRAWPLMEFWGDKVKRGLDVVDGFIDPLCEAAVRRERERRLREGGGGDGASAKEKEKEEVGEEETLLEHLVKLTDDPQIVHDETLNILLAGRDTTAITLTMAAYMLALHPHVLKRLRDEVQTRVGARRPTYDDIREMKYLRAFINEVLRLYPPVPFNVRYAINATTWPSLVPGGKPFYVPAGVRCLYSVFIMHRRKDLWGPDADKFDPDRFLDERLHRYLTPNPFIFVPFNAGPRICLGQQFAYNEASFMLIRLLQRVSHIELVQEVNPAAVPPPEWGVSGGSDGSDKVVFRGHLTMYVQGGLWVKMTEEPLAGEDAEADV
uniref:Cytochrom P450 n=1 Tax=Phlebia brevispora TaxID=194682 RepID=G5ELB1_9APHY|nr:cytochrom P450 [Phlebia brevispora]